MSTGETPDKSFQPLAEALSIKQIRAFPQAAKKHIPLAKRFEDYSGEAQSGEYDWGEPRGKEI